MWFTFWMLTPPVALGMLGSVFSAVTQSAISSFFWGAAVVWLWADLYIVPLYWAVRIVRYAWFRAD